MEKPVRYSIRSKLLSLLISLPFVFLTIFVVISYQTFVGDKISYVYDSAANRAQGLANEFSLSYESLERKFQPIVSVSQIHKNKFGQESIKRFREQKDIEYLYLVKSDENGLKVVDTLINYPREIKSHELTNDIIQSLVNKLTNHRLHLENYSKKSRFFIAAQNIQLKDKEKKTGYLVIGLVKMTNLYEAFSSPGVYSPYLVSIDENIKMKPRFWRESKKKESTLEFDTFRRAFEKRQPQGAFEKKMLHGDRKFIVAFARTKFKDFYAFSVVDKNLVISIIKNYLIKSVLFLVATLSLLLIVGFLLSLSMTTSIGRLVEMTKSIASGDFDQTIKIKSNDEIEVLSGRIHWMAQEVKHLLNSKIDQARMESELEMVHTVQKNLFPPLSCQVGHFTIECHFEPASEAGGDWFHYSIIKDQLIIWIGDATGHGAAAALITAAAKATSSVVELRAQQGEVLNPSEILAILNYSVNSTAKASVMMTFFLAAIDIKTGQVTYANASHESPIVIPKKDQLKKNDLDVLMEVNGRRLGESLDSKYKSAVKKLDPGDTLFFYTDGITDLQNPDGQIFGEGKLLRMIAKHTNETHELSEFSKKIKSSITDYRKQAPLADDLMFILCRYNPEVVKSELAV